MAQYSYLRNGFSRFHSMNAQWKHELFYEEHRYFERLHFISYATPICSVLYDSFNDVTTYYVNRDYFDCSRSTSRQFNRWLRECELTLTLNDFKRIDRESDGRTSYIVDDYTYVVWQNSSDIERKF